MNIILTNRSTNSSDGHLFNNTMDPVNVVIKPPAQLLQEVEIHQHIDPATCCDDCMATCSSLKRCAQCKEVKYCSKKCQARAWKQGHKHSCGKICIRAVPGKGMGVIAMRDIKRGEVVVSENPLLQFTFGKGLTESLQKTSTSSRKKLMSLHDRQSDGRKSLLGVVVTNCLGGRDGATTIVYYTISRFNHSCLPNVRVDQRFPTNVIAIRDIEAKEELCWCYDIETCMQEDTASRRIELRQGWGIPHCMCQCCKREDMHSDRNRLTVKHIEEKLSRAIFARESHSVEDLVRQKRAVLNVEGLDTADCVGRLCKDLMHADVCDDVKEAYREEGRQYAAMVKDDDLLEYFEGFDLSVGCKGCHRCKKMSN